ncbi:MAG: HAD family hydrolase [Candidatus Pacebacteria bacterium]|nr:HAD family hydrolase [Candidatus Paceibacterota bacterium]
MIKALIYDFDGTLADTFSLHLKAYKFALSKFGIKATRNEIINGCFNKLDNEASKNFGISNATLFSKYYREGLLKAFKTIKLYPNVASTLSKLKNNGLLLGIATSRNRDEMKKALKILKIEKYFDSIITHDEVKKKKPHPEIFLTVCKELGVKPAEVLIIGDAETDLVAANSILTKSILFYPKKHEYFYSLSNLKKLKPHYIIKNNKEIIDILKKI